MRKAVTIWSQGTKLAGDLFIPDDIASGEKRPAILLCHGWGGLKEHLERIGLWGSFITHLKPS